MTTKIQLRRNAFFPKSANVHPLSAGYEREGELIAAMLRQFLPIK